MKVSNYNIFFRHKQKNFAFNSLTCALGQYDSIFSKILSLIKRGGFDKSALNEEEFETFKKMQQDGFIIEDCFDELEFLKFKYYRGKFNNNGLVLTIAPTMACNFACPYCYENSEQMMRMPESVIKAIKNRVLIAANHKQNLHVTWYGGEPLVAKEIIWDLSKYFIKVCTKNDVGYGANIVTNGYLIDDEVINNFIKYKISSVQITIDGPPKIHNKRRKLKSSLKPTFDTIINNAKKILDAKISLTIRINVDKTNVSEIDGLLEILLKKGMRGALVRLGHVKHSTSFCEFSKSECLTNAKFAEVTLKTEKKLLKLGFNSKQYPSYPKLKCNVCSADSLRSRVIAPDGSMYKCWHDISDNYMCIGNILDEETKSNENVMNHVRCMMTSVFSREKCLNCKVLPLCMGGCPSLANPSDNKCVRWKYNLVATLKAKLDHDNLQNKR